MKEICELINQLTALELRMAKESHSEIYARQIQRMKNAIEQMGYQYQIPLNEKISEARTDLEVNIVGDKSTDLEVQEVIKPIIYEQGKLIQKGIAIAS